MRDIIKNYWDTLRWQVRAFFQRRTRGFDDSDLWSLHYTILKFVLPRLKRYREVSQNSWPGPEAIFDIDYDDFIALPQEEQNDLSDQSIEEWDRMLGKMIRAIELWIEHDGLFSRETPELEAEYNEGWDLFIKWFHALWD